MIFATVGTQLPFDRLIAALDAWAAVHPQVAVYAQVGCGNYLPSHMAWTRDMEPAAFRARMAACDTVVAHAGMGSIISGIELGKRVIVMPRRAALGEHRNEHQLATVARLSHLRGLEVVHDAAELEAALAYDPGRRESSAPAGADPGLIAAIRGFAGLEAAT
jgi:UDP-N-acetylglucosamine transferase subunit ALG13